MTIWRQHDGGDAPVADTQIVIVKYRNGVVSAPIAVRTRRWRRWPAALGPSDWDIVEWCLR